MKGPQADIGAAGGVSYEESTRGLLEGAADQLVKVDDWNTYAIEAKGPKIRTLLNGNLCVDLTDAQISRRGIFALQLHSGGPMEVRFKDIKLEVLSKGQK